MSDETIDFSQALQAMKDGKTVINWSLGHSYRLCDGNFEVKMKGYDFWMCKNSFDVVMEILQRWKILEEPLTDKQLLTMWLKMAADIEFNAVKGGQILAPWHITEIDTYRKCAAMLEARKEIK